MTINGYEMKTTFWQDFTIADVFGTEAIKDTFNRAFDEWNTDTVYITELALVTNWKCWQHYEKGNEELSKLYQKLFYHVDDWCYDNLKGKDLDYYWRTTD